SCQCLACGNHISDLYSAAQVTRTRKPPEIRKSTHGPPGVRASRGNTHPDTRSLPALSKPLTGDAHRVRRRRPRTKLVLQPQTLRRNLRLTPERLRVVRRNVNRVNAAGNRGRN